MAPRAPLDRIRRRPLPCDWKPDELLTFAEAAALVFPHGPFSAAALRNAHRRGELRATRLAGRSFTTRAALQEMMDIPRSTDPRAGCSIHRSGAPPPSAADVQRHWSGAFRAAVAVPRRR